MVLTILLNSLTDWLPTQLSGQTPGWHAAILSLVFFQTGRRQTFCAHTQMHLVADTSIFTGERTQEEARNLRDKWTLPSGCHLEHSKHFVHLPNLQGGCHLEFCLLPSSGRQTFCAPTKMHIHVHVSLSGGTWLMRTLSLADSSIQELQQQWGKNAETQWQLQRPEKFCLNLGPANTS